MGARCRDGNLTLVCDGGSLGNPGKGYGSYHLSDGSGWSDLVRLDYPGLVTNNQAEYRTLIAGLERGIELAAERGWRLADVCMTVRTDSKLVVEQLLGRWKVRNAGLQPLHAQARALLSRYGHYDIVWQPRAASVEVLGH